MRLTVFFKIILVFLFSIDSLSQEIKWISLEDAVYLQEASPRNILIDVYTNWCGPCKSLDRITFSNKSVIKYINDNFYAVKFNAEGNDVINFKGYEFTNPNYNPSKSNRRNSSHQLTRSLGVSAYPTIVFLDKSSNLVHRLRGYQSPKQIEVYLKLFTDENFRQIQTQKDFQNFYDSFEYQFESK
jgi:thioredoxin-related protein